MSNEVKPLQVKEGMVVILRALENGPLGFSKLRTAYFGEGRAKLPATTAFYMKTKEALEKKLIQKIDKTYSLTELGQVTIAAVPDEVKASAKSEAQKAFEASPKGIAWAAAQAETEVAA